jgi:hypothetical protein
LAYISTNGKLFMLPLVVLSFAAPLLPHNLTTPLYAKIVEKDANHSDSSYPPITPTSSASPNNGDNQPQHHSTSSNNNQYHEHQGGGSGSNSGGSGSNSDDNNAIIEINTQ